MNDLIYEVLRFIVVISVMALVRYAIPLLKSKVKNSNLEWLYDWAVYAVKAAEQTHTESGLGTLKKSVVKEFLLRITRQYGVEITDAQIENLIESAVYAMKQEGQK